MIELVTGLLASLLPTAALCVWLDRRDATRRRTRLRVDQQPRPLPGAYEHPRRPALPGSGGPTVIDQEP